MIAFPTLPRRSVTQLATSASAHQPAKLIELFPSAVCDLFGTMHDEGASKGILVTTSGCGAAAHEFANGKPLVGA
jgi:hypothetical protein